jgi:hypothetical protein
MLHAGFLLGWIFTLKIEVIRSSETYQIRTTRSYIPGDGGIHTYRYESLKSDILNLCYFLRERDQVLHPYRTTKKTKPRGLSPWENYIAACRRVSAKFSNRECHVVSVTDPYSRILGFLDRSRYFFFQVAPQLYSRGWVDPVPDPLLLIKCGSSWDRTRTSGSAARNSDHSTTEAVPLQINS